MEIRTATMNDLLAIVEVEKMCFPPNQAATEKGLKERLEVYPNHFWMLENDVELIGFIDGMATNSPTINDDMFTDASLHEENGEWQAIFGVNTAPKYRKCGYAAQIMEKLILDAKNQGRRGCILTCKKELIHYYEKFGYKNEGVSRSILGGVVWYDMRLEF